MKKGKILQSVITVLMISGLMVTADATFAAEKLVSTHDSAALSLTTEQHTKIQTLRENRWNDLKPLRNLLLTKFNELKALLSRSHPDEGSLLQAKQSEILDIQSKIHEKMASYRQELRKILTKEQQAQLSYLGLERGYFRSGFKNADFREKE